MMIDDPTRLDRACGVLLATAAGDALGAGYEFGPPLPDSAPVAMRGGGGFDWSPGEWTDDTSMAVAIAQVASDGADLRSSAAQDRIVAAWVEWARTATDVGNQTRAVLSQVGGGGAAAARDASANLHRRTGHTGGNGSLMRTAPVALAFLDDPDGLVQAAGSLSALTHFDPEAGEACVLWCSAIRHAVLTGELDVRVGLSALSAGRAAVWSERIELAERSRPADFAQNGWVVEALQAAWCAIATTPVPDDDPATGRFRVDHLRLALEAAVRGGRDTDTVAAIAGGLLGAAYGASAVPASWRVLLHGWPGLRARHLVELASSIVRQGRPDPFDFTYARWGDPSARAQHPYDEQLWLGGIGSLRDLPAGVDAVVSLCRVGEDDLPAVAAHVEVRLIDRVGANPHLAFVLDDTVRVVEELRAAGRTVLVHCVQAQSRTPTVAALYGMRRRGVPAAEALADVMRVLPSAHPNPEFRAALQAADPTS
jgi:ADP-ribosyl-[dinitrogen reductase] hydrolase